MLVAANVASSLKQRWGHCFFQLWHHLRTLIRLHTAPSVATTGFIQLCSHIQWYSSTPKQTCSVFPWTWTHIFLNENKSESYKNFHCKGWLHRTATSPLSFREWPTHLPIILLTIRNLDLVISSHWTKTEPHSNETGWGKHFCKTISLWFCKMMHLSWQYCARKYFHVCCSTQWQENMQFTVQTEGIPPTPKIKNNIWDIPPSVISSVCLILIRRLI